MTYVVPLLLLIAGALIGEARAEAGRERGADVQASADDDVHARVRSHS